MQHVGHLAQVQQLWLAQVPVILQQGQQLLDASPSAPAGGPTCSYSISCWTDIPAPVLLHLYRYSCPGTAPPVTDATGEGKQCVLQASMGQAPDYEGMPSPIGPLHGHQQQLSPLHGQQQQLSPCQHGDKWQDTKAFKTYQEMLQSEQSKPDAAFIGVPPQFHGGLSDKNNIELKLAQAGVHLFVEKPLSIQSAEEVAKLADELKQVQDQQKLIIAVGYMFRYPVQGRLHAARAVKAGSPHCSGLDVHVWLHAALRQVQVWQGAACCPGSLGRSCLVQWAAGKGSRSGVPGALFRCCVASWLNRAVCCPCRYSALARTAKRILEKYNAQPLGVNARYACAYSTIEKRDCPRKLGILLKQPHAGAAFKPVASWQTGIQPIAQCTLAARAQLQHKASNLLWGLGPSSAWLPSQCDAHTPPATSINALQATHFVDLMRFFCGEIEQDSVQAVAVGPQAKLSDMPAPPAAEAEASLCSGTSTTARHPSRHACTAPEPETWDAAAAHTELHQLRKGQARTPRVPMNKRINRVTGAIWRFKSGAVGSLFHSLVLHGATYDTELEVLADGLRMVLRDPYGKPQLLVRHPHEEEYKEPKTAPVAELCTLECAGWSYGALIEALWRAALQSGAVAAAVCVPSAFMTDWLLPCLTLLTLTDSGILQARAFIDAVQQGDGSGVASLFSDAAMSYQASCRAWILASRAHSIIAAADTGTLKSWTFRKKRHSGLLRDPRPATLDHDSLKRQQSQLSSAQYHFRLDMLWPISSNDQLGPHYILFPDFCQLSWL
eukprot:jgi/Astpho2/5060/fgenesh1_pg.00071_%23_40_t